jgi:hypothetical protein
MRAFSPIFLPDALVRAGKSILEMPEHRGVPAQLVGDEQFQSKSLFHENPAHQPLRQSACHTRIEPMCRRPHHRGRHVQRYIRLPAIRTPSRPDATSCLAEVGTSAAVAGSSGRTSTTNSGQFS